MQLDQGETRAPQSRSLAAAISLGFLSLGSLLLAGCAASSSASKVAPGSQVSGEVATMEASYDLVVDGTGAVTGSLAVEVVDPRGSSGKRRRLSPRELELGATGAWLPAVLDPASLAMISAEVSAADEVYQWSAPRGLPLASIDPRDVALGLLADEGVSAAARRSFIAFAEELLLRRDPLAGQPLAGSCARAWFGLLVRARAGDEHPPVPTLADLLFAMFREQDAEGAAELEAAGWYRPSPDADWATSRWLLLRQRLGSVAFIEGLRAVVDAGADGDPLGLEEVAASFPKEGEAFILSWLRGPAGPLVETSWRFDTERQRLLLRIDQLQRVTPGAAPAYSFVLPVTVTLEDGLVLRRTLEVSRRKELFQLPIEGTPKGVEFDPDQTLEALVKLRAATEP